LITSTRRRFAGAIDMSTFQRAAGRFRKAFNSPGAVRLLGAIALVGSAATLRGQEPTTIPGVKEVPLEAIAPFSPTQSSEDVRGELETVTPVAGAVFDVGIEDVFPQGFKDGRAELKERYGFDIGFAYTALYQQASGGPGRRNAAGGDVDIFGAWRLVGSADRNAGSIVWAADNRHALFTELTPGELGPEIGTLFDTTDGFNEREFALRQLYWQQNLADDKLVLSVGKLDAGNYYNGNRASNDNLLALNKSLSANPARFFPAEGIGFNVRVVPRDVFFVSAGIHDANAEGTETGLNTAFKGDYLYAAEVGVTPQLESGLEGIYRVAAWYNDPADQGGKDRGWGIGLSATQFVTATSGVALRYGWQSADDIEVEQVASAQYLSYAGGTRSKDVWGVGVGWGRPSDGDLDDEFVGEVFYRIQLTRNAQLTPDVQVIVNPSNAPDDDVLAVFGVRLRTAF
jgi:porin